jgi:hypothetical protein
MRAPPKRKDKAGGPIWALELQGKRDEALQAAEKAKTLDLLGPGR